MTSEFRSRSAENIGPSEDKADRRRKVIDPRLAKSGWSTLDWAKEANVDYNTASDYLNGRTTPRRHTLRKLAQAIGVSPLDMPI
jgi:ribosome-binding protein aMBF1 (putative translation factor)